MAPQNPMMGKGNDGTLVLLLFSWCGLKRERRVERSHFTQASPRISGENIIPTCL